MGGGVTITPTMYSNLSHRMCPGTTASTVVGSALGRSYLACKLRGCGMGLLCSSRSYYEGRRRNLPRESKLDYNY